MYRRYAIYVTPSGAFAQTGAAWLGWDMTAGCTVAHPDIDGVDIAAITKRPRRYGLHATLKPPMVLAEGTTREELIQAAGAVARSAAPLTLDGLEMSRLGRFLALTALGDQTALNAVAAQVVESLDRFRAPATEQDLARRRQRPLTASQEHNLTRWGYPHVMDDFRFHITLTGPLKDATAMMPVVLRYFAPVLPTPFVIDHLTLAGEDAAGMFHSIAHLPLGG